MNILDFDRRKQSRQKISMVTCYDYTSACILENTDVDTLLVGDSLAMVMHGFDSTVHATINMMATHTAAVRRGAPTKFIVGDIPFLSARRGTQAAMDDVAALMRAGANSVKIEGEAGQLDLMAHIVESGVPVMGHLGLTPQSVEAFGGHKVQGRSEGQAASIIDSAKRLEQAGCFALVLECVPEVLATSITEQIGIPTIGIGASPACDGQILVVNDLIGLASDYMPKFVKRYAETSDTIRSAVSAYADEVRARTFPGPEHCFGMPKA